MKLRNTVSGIGFAIEPEIGDLFAPFDGKFDFTFSTKHVLGVVSNNGLKAIIHALAICVEQGLCRIMWTDSPLRRGIF